MPPILNAQGVSKRFGAVPLFDEISFVVSDGDRIGLIGPNGAGKSTLLKVLAGDEDPDAGEVSTRKRARIGYVRQESAFKAGLTVRDVLEAAMVAAGVPEAERDRREFPQSVPSTELLFRHRSKHVFERRIEALEHPGQSAKGDALFSALQAMQ